MKICLEVWERLGNFLVSNEQQPCVCANPNNFMYKNTGKYCYAENMLMRLIILK